MKIDQEKQEFKPVTITLETQEEMQLLYDSLEGSLIRSQIAYDISRKLEMLGVEVSDIVEKKGTVTVCAGRTCVNYPTYDSIVNDTEQETGIKRDKIKHGDIVEIISIDFSDSPLIYTEEMAKVGQTLYVDDIDDYSFICPDGYGYPIHCVQKV